MRKRSVPVFVTKMTDIGSTPSGFLSLSGISKSFPGVKALQSVSLDVNHGEVVGLIGENGAGKSTLVKILAGIHHPDSGSIQIDGQDVKLRSPGDAGKCGIGIIHQELELIDTLDVASNIFLGREPTWAGPAKLVDTRRIRSEAEEVLSRLRVPLSPRTRVSELSLAQRQMIEIARALSLNARILLMDEPTSSLTLAEAERLLQIVRELRGQNVGILYISHRLGEIQSVADRVVALRDGKNAGVLEASEITHERMIRLMVGRDLESMAPPAAGVSGVSRAVFEVQKFRTQSHPGKEVSLAIHGGEILGVAGLVGAGRSELARAMFGVDARLSGKLVCGGREVPGNSVKGAIANGIYLVPEDRRGVGLITEMNIRENVTLPALRRYASRGLMRRQAERAAAETERDRLKIKASSVEMAAGNLSGGNQQKVVLAKWLSLSPKLLLFDEPTRGIDVGAKAEIYQIMRRLAAEGVAIMMISSDMEEILLNSDRVAVMREGQVTGVLARADCSEQAIMRLAVA
jgi:ribose transport system ATP-binding protein